MGKLLIPQQSIILGATNRTTITNAATAARTQTLRDLTGTVALEGYGTVISVTASTYTALSTNDIVLLNNATGVTVTMFNATTGSKVIRFKNIGAGNCTITATALGQIFFNSALQNSIVLPTGATIELISNGTNWFAFWFSLSGYPKFRAVSAGGAITEADDTVQVTGTFTMTLPTCVGIIGKKLLIKAKTGTVTLTPNGAETIESSTNLILAPGSASELQSDGTSNWIII